MCLKNEIYFHGTHRPALIFSSQINFDSDWNLFKELVFIVGRHLNLLILKLSVQSSRQFCMTKEYVCGFNDSKQRSSFLQKTKKLVVPVSHPCLKASFCEMKQLKASPSFHLTH